MTMEISLTSNSEFGPLPEEYMQKFKENEDAVRFQIPLDADGWIFNSNENQIDIYVKTTKRSDGSQVNWVKGVGFIQASPKIIHRVLYDIENRDKWDSMFLGGKRLATYGRFSNKGITSFSAPWPVSSREFVAITNTYFSSDGSILLATNSVEDNNIPVQSGHVRGEVINSGFYIKPVGENKSQVTYILATDPKGSIPNFVVAVTSTKQALLIYTISEHIKKNREKLEEQVKALYSDIPIDSTHSLSKSGEYLNKNIIDDASIPSRSSNEEEYFIIHEPDDTGTPKSSNDNSIKIPLENIVDDTSAQRITNLNVDQCIETNTIIPDNDNNNLSIDAKLDLFQISIETKERIKNVLAAKYITISEEYSQKFKVNTPYLRSQIPIDAEGWTFNSTNNQVDIYVKTTKRSDDSQVNWVKGVGIVQGSPKIVQGVIIDIENRGKWDGMFLGANILERYDTFCTKNISHFDTPWPVANREFLCISDSFIFSDGSILMVTNSVEDNSIPVKSDFVRGEVVSSGFYIKPVGKNTSQITYILATDPKGNIPTFVVALTATKQALLVYNISEYIKKNLARFEDEVEAFHSVVPVRIHDSPDSILFPSPQSASGSFDIKTTPDVSSLHSDDKKLKYSKKIKGIQTIEDRALDCKDHPIIQRFKNRSLFQKFSEAFNYLSSTKLEKQIAIGVACIHIDSIKLSGTRFDDIYKNLLFFQFIHNDSIEEIRLDRRFSQSEQLLQIKQTFSFEVTADSVLRISVFFESQSKDILCGMVDIDFSDLPSNKWYILKQDDNSTLSILLKTSYYYSKFNEFIGGAFSKGPDPVDPGEYQFESFISNTKRLWYSLGPITLVLYLLWNAFLYHMNLLSILCLAVCISFCI